MMKGTASTLTCQRTLLPPPKRIGTGDNALVYHESQPAWQCAFSPDGLYVAVCYGSPDPCVRIWKQQPSLDHARSTAPSSSTTQQSPNTECWRLVSTLRSQERTIRSIVFAPISSPLTLASASFDGTVVIWEQLVTNPSTTITSKQQGDDEQWDCTAQLEGHDSEVKCVTWNHTGSLLATCGRDKSVWIWECFLPGTIGGTHSSGGGGGEYECLAVLNGHEADVKCVRFAHSHGQWGDGDEIVCSASYDDTIKIWAEDASDWYCAASICSVHSSTIWALAVAPSHTRLVSGSDDGSLAIYKFYTASEISQCSPQEDGGSNKGMCKCVGTLPNAHSSTIYSVDYASAKCGHGRIASGGADNYIRIYRETKDSTSLQPHFALDASIVTNHGDVNCVCWHPWDGSILASANDDGSVQIWRFAPSSR